MRIGALAAAVIFAGLATTGATPIAQEAQKPASVERTFGRDDGTMIMRMLLSTQANKPFGAKGYGTLAEILRLMPAVKRETTILDSQTATMRGYTIRLTRSEDRRRFDIAIMQEGSCGLSWFSNEKNVIYSGHPIGCPAQ